MLIWQLMTLKLQVRRVDSDARLHLFSLDHGTYGTRDKIIASVFYIIPKDNSKIFPACDRWRLYGSLPP